MPAVDPCYRYRFAVDRVIDGDTFIARVDMGFYVTAAIRVRVRGCNAPELHSETGPAAAAFTVNLFAKAKELVLESYKDHRSFERWVCDVYVDGENLAELLIASNMAVAMADR